MKTLILTLLLILVFAQELKQLQLNTQLTASLGAKERAYYSVTIPEILDNNQVLIATVDVVEDHVAPEIFISTKEKFPSYDTADQTCLGEKIDSCALGNLLPGLQVYISVFCIDGCNYTLFVDLEPTRQIQINKKFTLDFNTSSSGILTFVLEQQYSQFIIFAQDLDFYASNHYRMLIGKGFIPSENNYSFYCTDIGPYRKAIKLNKDEIAVNTTYYLLVEAQQNTSIYLNTQTYETGEEGYIAPNSTIFDYLEQEQNYSLSYVLTNQSVQKPLYIRLKSYSGTGTILITHCGLHQFVYWNNNGQNEEIRIGPKQRQQCLTAQQMLLVENIEIQVVPFRSTYSFSIGSRQSTTSSEVRFAQYESGTLGLGEYSNYTLSLLLTQPTKIYLNIWTQNGDNTFIVSQCTNDSTNCKNLGKILSQGNIQIPYDPTTCDGRCYLQLDIEAGQQDSQFGFIFRASGYRMKLDEDTVDVGFISMNQYIYYNLTISNPKDVYSVTIKVVQFAGEVNLIGSQSIENPQIYNTFQGSQAIMNWNNVITFTENLSNPIYLSVLGQKEAIYKITISVDREQNTPTKYIRLEDKVPNELRTTGDPILVRYYPSESPYYISFYPTIPSCVSYGDTLPLEPICMTLPQTFSGQLYMNITGVSGELVKLSITSQTFDLTPSNPLFLDCSDTCTQVIMVRINNGSVGVMHSGYGRISSKDSNTTVNNGLLNLICPNEQTVCIMTVVAELNWGEMVVSMESDDTFRINWYPQSVSLKSLPKKLIYKLPKNTPSVITIVSKIASLDLYANIQTLDSEHTNHLALSYPNRTSYDFKVQSDFFKRTLTLQIPTALQQQLGCFSDNQYCILTMTVFLNNHCRDIHLVDDSIFLVSASSYTMILQQNTKYLMQDISELEYYEYKSTITKDFTFMIEPISNCKPLLVYSNDTDFPTDDIKSQESYHSISIINSTRAVVGVISEIDCLYNIMVSIDNVSSNYRVLIQGFAETINLPKNSTNYFYYESPNRIPFQISGTISNIPIYILQVPDGVDPSDYLPKKGNNNYTSPNLPIVVNNTEPTRYMIALVNTFSTNISTSLLITQQGLQVIMTHNRIYQQKTQEENAYLFRYYSANSFVLVFVASSGSFTVNINAAPDINITKVINDTSTQSTIQIPSDGDLKPYWIEITSASVGYFSIQVIEIGGEASPTLSSGLPYFDAFTQNPQTNCYQFKGDPTNSDPIRVSMIYSEDFIKNLTSSNATLRSLELTFSYSFKSYIDQNQTVSLRNSLHFVQGITFSLDQKYGLYNFCFENTADQLVDISYYVVLASKELQFLVPTLSFFVSDNKAQLDKYQLIATEPKTVIAELMNCQGQTQLTANSNYSQILSGKTTQIHNQFSSGPYYSGIVNISKGYYYLGAKAIQPNSSYIIRFTTLNQSQDVVLSEMSLINTDLKWYGSDDSLVVSINPLKCQSYCNKTKYIRYYLYLGKNLDSINKRTRCGIQDQSSPVQMYNTIQSDLSANNSISFKVPLSHIPNQFALTVRAEAIQSNGQDQPRSVYYFYNTTSMLQATDIDFDDDWFSWEAMVLTMIIMGLVLIFFLICICKRYKIGPFRNSRAVQFQVTDFVNDSSRQAEISNESSNRQNRGGQIQLQQVQRRQVDDGVGVAYGEFIDESRI